MIRPATPDDVPAVVGLVEDLADYERERDKVELTPDLLTEALFGPEPSARCFVAVDSVAVDSVGTDSAGTDPVPTDPPAGTVVGMALWFRSFSTWTGRPGLYLEDLYVRPEHRRAGHGRQLLAALAAECVARGWGRLEWSVLDWNTPAIAFYRSIGAVAMDEWTTMRMAGNALTALAANAGDRERGA